MFLCSFAFFDYRVSNRFAVHVGRAATRNLRLIKSTTSGRGPEGVQGATGKPLAAPAGATPPHWGNSPIPAPPTMPHAEYYGASAWPPRWAYGTFCPVEKYMPGMLSFQKEKNSFPSPHKKHMKSAVPFRNEDGAFLPSGNHFNARRWFSN